MEDKKRNPLISIIIPCYNRVELIGETLDSVNNQTYENWECIVVDDGSNDGSQELIKQKASKDNRFSLYQRNRTPKGPATSRNIGIKHSKGEFLLFLDSDDIMMPNVLKKRIAMSKKLEEFDLLILPMGVFKGSIENRQASPHTFIDGDDLSKFLKGIGPWEVSSPFWPRKILMELNGFDENLFGPEEVDLSTRFLQLNRKYRYKLVGKKEPDIFYRYDSEGSITSAKTLDRLITQQFKYIKKHLAIINSKEYQFDRNNSKNCLKIRGRIFFNKLLVYNNYQVATEFCNSLKSIGVLGGWSFFRFKLELFLYKTSLIKIKGMGRVINLLFKDMKP